MNNIDKQNVFLCIVQYQTPALRKSKKLRSFWQCNIHIYFCSAMKYFIHTKLLMIGWFCSHGIMFHIIFKCKLTIQLTLECRINILWWCVKCASGWRNVCCFTHGPALSTFFCTTSFKYAYLWTVIGQLMLFRSKWYCCSLEFMRMSTATTYQSS